MRYFLLIFFLTISLFADRGLQLKKMAQEQRLALVVGNNSYQSLSSLKNPINDAKAMRDALQERGFSVIYLENATQRKFSKQVKKFAARLRDGGVGLFYYAGHGIAVEGNNYLVATDSDISDPDDVKYETIALNWITDRMRHAHNRVNIIILDACRNDPFSRSGGGGLVPLRNARGMFVAYATEAGAVAQDGSGNNSLFTKHLIHYIAQPVKIEEVFKRTRREVAIESNHEQFPSVYNQLYGDFYFTLPKIKKASKKSVYSVSTTSEKYALHVNTEPSDARVYITNIKPKYHDGIMLLPGAYNIKVIRSGYHAKQVQLDLYSDLSLKIVLQKKKKSMYKKLETIIVPRVEKTVREPSKLVKKTVKQVDSSQIFLDFYTSLMWQDDHAVKTNARTWYEAKDYCSNLSLEGYTDWALPLIDELKTLIDKKQTPPIKEELNNFVISSSANYWSNTSDLFDDINALYFYNNTGYSFEKNKFEKCYVRCVRMSSKNILNNKASSSPKKVNQNKTLMDVNTDLMWQDNYDVTLNNRTWNDAKMYCSNLSLEGYRDWKLPTVSHLKSTLDMNKRFNNIALPSRSYYWSSSNKAFTNSNAWYFYFKYGDAGDTSKTKEFYVRCVRATHEVFLDLDTNLVWQDNYVVTKNEKTWHEAKTYCSNLSLEDYTDWRLPTIRELRSIVDKEKSPSIKIGFSNINDSSYWSSSVDDFDEEKALYLYFINGYSFDDSKSEEYYVRCVRGTKK